MTLLRVLGDVAQGARIAQGEELGRFAQRPEQLGLGSGEPGLGFERQHLGVEMLRGARGRDAPPLRPAAAPVPRRGAPVAAAPARAESRSAAPSARRSRPKPHRAERCPGPCRGTLTARSLRCVPHCVMPRPHRRRARPPGARAAGPRPARPSDPASDCSTAPSIARSARGKGPTASAIAAFSASAVSIREAAIAMACAAISASKPPSQRSRSVRSMLGPSPRRIRARSRIACS